MLSIKYTTPTGPLWVSFDVINGYYGLGFSKEKADFYATKSIKYANEGLPPFMYQVGSPIPVNAKMNISRLPTNNAITNILPYALVDQYDLCIVKDNDSSNYCVMAFDIVDRNRELLYFWGNSLLSCLFQFILKHHYDLDKPTVIWHNGDKKKKWTANYMRNLPKAEYGV